LGLPLELPIHAYALLCRIAETEIELGVLEAGESIGLSRATAARTIALLGRGVRQTQAEPLDLIELDTDPNDYRRKIVRLTNKGRDVIKLIHKTLTSKQVLKES
jgi:DNA-binding MarR family transcriptional regulator